ncbi:MAG: hypothetical protein ACK5O7_02560 [Holosporales bacterium]
MKNLGLSLMFFHALSLSTAAASTLCLEVLDQSSVPAPTFCKKVLDNQSRLALVRPRGDQAIETLRARLKGVYGYDQETDDEKLKENITSRDQVYNRVVATDASLPLLDDIYHPEKIVLWSDANWMVGADTKVHHFGFEGYRHAMVSQNALVERLNEAKSIIAHPGFKADIVALTFDNILFDEATLDHHRLRDSFSAFLGSNSKSFHVSFRRFNPSFMTPMLVALVHQAHRVEKIWVGETEETVLPREAVGHLQNLLQASPYLHHASLMFQQDEGAGEANKWAATLAEVLKGDYLESIELSSKLTQMKDPETTETLSPVLREIIRLDGEQVITAYRTDTLDSAQVLGVFTGEDPHDIRREHILDLYRSQEVSMEQVVAQYLSSGPIRLCRQKFLDTLLR